MSASSVTLSHYNSNLRHVLTNATADRATQAVRTRMFRASLVENPLGEQVSIDGVLTALRERGLRD